MRSDPQTIRGVKRFLGSSIGFAILGLCFASTSYAGPGTLDRSFDRDGKVITTVNFSADAQDVLIQADGKVITVGQTPWAYSSGGADILVIRYNSDGSLDTSFGGTGIVKTDFNGGDDGASAVAAQSDGKLVVTGQRKYVNPTNSAVTSDLILVRYRTDGSLDSGFGIGGLVIVDVNGANETSYNVAIQSDGKIVVLSNTFVARFLGNGSLDTSFGSGGMVSNGTWVVDPCCSFNSAFPDGFVPASMALQADKIVLGGQTSAALAAVIRLNLNGSLDTTFGVAGIAKTPASYFAYSYGFYMPVAVQPDKKIVLGIVVAADKLNVVRFNENGQVDSAFGSAGTAATISPYPIDLRDIAIGKDNRILLGGTAYVPSKYKTAVNSVPSTQLDFALIRLNSNGSMDNTFGSKGVVVTDFAATSAGYDSFDRSTAVTIQSDGKIVSAGSVSGSVDGVGVARYLAQ